MWIARPALNLEIPGAAYLSTREVCELVAALGFPVDAVEERKGETVIDVDITANRGDVMSHRGLAREIGAKLGQALAPLPWNRLSEGQPGLEIRLEAEACPLYAAALMSLGEGPGTPAEVQTLLAALGSSAKLLAPVDASNELLHRYGHPTHAFDAHKLEGAIRVRWAREGERLVTLDGVERSLDGRDLVIADDGGPIAMAGLMGGDGSKVTSDTRRVLLESAYFDPKVVRAMARRHGLHTDASHRFGRGADCAMPRVARDLFAQRLSDWAGAKVEAAWTVGAQPQIAQAIPLTPQLLGRVAGEALDLDEAADLLHRLGCTVLRHPGGISAAPPTWRHDLGISEDLAEEVLRLRGYERIASALPPLEGSPEPLSPAYLQRQGLARRLAVMGFHQTVTYGFLSPDLDQGATPQEGRTLFNPLGLEHSVMRGSLLPSLLQAADHNLRQGAREVRLFEMAPVYESSPEGPVEIPTLALVWAGETGGADPLTPKGAVHPAALQGVVAALGADASVHELGDGKGLLGVELPLASLPLPEGRIIPRFQGFSRSPAVERDLSMVVPLGQPFGRLAEVVRDALLEAPLQGLTCADVYKGKALPEGTQAWLLRLIFQGDRTLTGEEVDGWMKAALAAAEAQGARLRG